MNIEKAKANRATIWFCGDGRYRVSVGGTHGCVLNGSGATSDEAREILVAYLATI